jgi:hypothetical protein
VEFFNDLPSTCNVLFVSPDGSLIKTNLPPVFLGAILERITKKDMPSLCIIYILVIGETGVFRDTGSRGTVGGENRRF